MVFRGFSNSVRGLLSRYFSLGRRGERAAAGLLRRAGYRVIGRNVVVPMGEADLLCVAPDGETVVIVEVKTRRVVGQGLSGGARPVEGAIPPEANITAHKRRKLASIARHLARANGWSDGRVRIDVVAVEWCDRGPTVMRHHVGVV